MGYEQGGEVVKHHFRFSLEYLVREVFIDQMGKGCDFAGLASHLHYVEPTNLLFVHLFRQEIFAKLISQIAPEHQAVELLNILCHLFLTLPAKRDTQQELILPELLPSISEEMEKFNKR